MLSNKIENGKSQVLETFILRYTKSLQGCNVNLSI